jgi:hypothetical protein
MVTSGTFAFTMTVEECIAKAAELVGGELLSANDLKQARKSLDLLFLDLQNRGYPLANLEKLTITTSASVASYTLPSSIVEVLDVVFSKDNIDTPMERIDILEYHRIPKKNLTGRPVQWALDRQAAAPVMYVYLTPVSTSNTIDYWGVRRVEDTGNYTNNIDFSDRYLPAIVMGLAYFMSLERTGFPMDKRAELRQNYQDMLLAAFAEDRGRASYTITPPRYFR